MTIVPFRKKKTTKIPKKNPDPHRQTHTNIIPRARTCIRRDGRMTACTQAHTKYGGRKKMLHP